MGKTKKSDKPQFAFPSQFGSHKSMIDETATAEISKPVLENGLWVIETPKLKDEKPVVENGVEVKERAIFNSSDLVVCKDENGLYTTERWKLDSGFADPNRNNGNRLKILQSSKKKKEE